MQIESSTENGVDVIRIVMPSLDADTVEEFQMAVTPLASSGRSVVLDLSGIGLVDSSGLGAILKLSRQLRGEGRTLALCVESPAVKAVVRMIGLQRVVGTFAQVPEAVEHCVKAG
ncbi:MAG: STAS domain-containing protein [Planctomycetota bacterium]|nr:STAS domain-containing protein [Planctomycetota bacterium]